MTEATSSWQPNFDWITDQLAVGGSFPAERVAHLASEHRINAVVDLRGEAKDDEELLRTHGMTLLHLPTPDMCGVDAAHLERGIDFATGRLERGERVLIHCEFGIGRSATLALCVMVRQGWSPIDALSRMKDRRALVSPSPSQFACWSEWMERHRGDRQVPWEMPSFDAFQRIAYRHLATTG